MRAIVLDRPGKPADLYEKEMKRPNPGPGEIRVRVHAASLNPVDYKLVAAGHPDWIYPFIPGLDAAGVIDAVGEQAGGWAVGDEVFFHGDLSQPGVFAEYAITTAHTTARLPRGLSFIEAAALPCAGMTAYQAVKRKISMAGMRSILIHGGAGGVGGFAIQLAHLAGLTVMTTCSPQNNQLVLELGADYAIDYRNDDVTDRVMELTAGQGADAIVNTISPDSAKEDIGRLAFNGHLVCIAGFPDLSDINTRDRAISIHTVALGRAHVSGDRHAQQDLARMAAELGQLAADGKVQAMVREVIDLSEIPMWLEQLSGRHVNGKIVVDLT